MSNWSFCEPVTPFFRIGVGGAAKSPLIRCCPSRIFWLATLMSLPPANVILSKFAGRKSVDLSQLGLRTSPSVLTGEEPHLGTVPESEPSIMYGPVATTWLPYSDCAPLSYF